MSEHSTIIFSFSNWSSGILPSSECLANAVMRRFLSFSSHVLVSTPEKKKRDMAASTVLGDLRKGRRLSQRRECWKPVWQKGPFPHCCLPWSHSIGCHPAHSRTLQLCESLWV